MAKLNKYDLRHQQHLFEIQALIDDIYAEAAREAAQIGAALPDFDPDRLFSFADYPSTRKRVNRLLQGLKTRLTTAVVNGVKSAWTLANNKNDELCRYVFGDNIGKLSGAQYRRYFNNNETARDTFIARKTAGLNLSDRVWNYTNQFKREIELGLDVGIRQGMSADEMSRALRQFLKYPDKLFRRVREGVDSEGNPIFRLSRAAAEFHPGQGVYRSSYKNARRLAATETNMAYRTADYDRRQQLDFVVGQLIEPSKTNHPVPDICDDLKGKYPKDFKFTGWHPHCRCHALSILKSTEEMIEDNKRILRGEEPTETSVNTVSEPPKGFNDWIEDNRERAKGWANMPYFVRENPQYVSDFRVDTYSPEERKFTRAHRTAPAMKEMMGAWIQARYPDIPNTEKAAIFHYTRQGSSDYRQLNKQLRENRLSEFSLAFSELLSSGLSKLPTVEMTTYRSVRLNKTQLRNWADMAGSRSEITFDGFTSTSESLIETQNFMLRKAASRKKNETDILLVIRGKTGHRIEDFSQFGGRYEGLPNQQEVLFDKGTKFIFEDVEPQSNGQWVFRLTEI